MQPRYVDWLSSSDHSAQCDVTSFVDGAVSQRPQEEGRLGPTGGVEALGPCAVGNCWEDGGAVRGTAYITASEPQLRWSVHCQAVHAKCAADKYISLNSN